MNLALTFLQMYDSCKRTQTPETCRKVVGAAIPQAINTYLVGYDACVAAFSPDTCKRYFAPEKEELKSWKLIAAFAIGVFIGWRVL